MKSMTAVLSIVLAGTLSGCAAVQYNDGEKVSIQMNSDELPGNVTLIISGTTPHSREKAVYEIVVD